MAGDLQAGLHEALISEALERALQDLGDNGLVAETAALADAEAPDRVSRHLARLIASAIQAVPEGQRSVEAIRIARDILDRLAERAPELDLRGERPIDPGAVLRALLRRRPDGTPAMIERPLTPLLDTTVFTNAPGEPAVGHELRAEIASAESIDLVMAFVRWSGVRPMLPELRRHCQSGKRLRLLTTTYTNSTEARALDELERVGAEVRVSYDTTTTRLHAKAWIFHRAGGYSTAYVGSSNLTHSAQITGLEWNVRLSEARNADATAKVAAVFEGYWEGRDFVPYARDEFLERTMTEPGVDLIQLSPVEVQPRPFQERLLELLAVSREHGHHRNLLVAATGTGKTVMAAIDYARQRKALPRDRLLFVAHRAEILEQSRATFRHALRDSAFGELWVGGQRPVRFDYVFASIQSLSASGIQAIEPGHFDVVIVDEFHHAAAPTYRALLEHINPVQLLGLTATPERADGLNVREYFDGRIAAELRVWDAIDQQYLTPFAYYGIHDGLDLRQVPWKRTSGYDVAALTNVLTADHAWARRVIHEVRSKIADSATMKALGFCVSVRHAEFMAAQFNSAGVAAVAVSADTPGDDRRAVLRDLARGDLNIVFAVDLFNEGVDVPTVDTLLLLRPTDSPTLFLQQLGRGLRRAEGKAVCTVLDFVGLHRKEFRLDRRFRALLGGSRGDLERQVNDGFPFLPAGCHLDLDPVARDEVLRSIRQSVPTAWRERQRELESLGDVSLARFVEETGLELEDIYANNRSWTDLRRSVGLPTQPAGQHDDVLLRAVGRLLHVDDDDRIDSYSSLLRRPAKPDASVLDIYARRQLRMLVASLTTLGTRDSLEAAVAEVWEHSQVRIELLEVLDLLRTRVDHVQPPLGIADVPLRIHARYTRNEIFAAFGIGDGASPPTWQTGVWWEPNSRSDLFAFTLDKTVGGFSPTTRYRDYAIGPDLIHWESQSTTAASGTVGRRYIEHRENGTNIVLFARLRTTDRAFWCLGPASYVSHEGDRPISFRWRLEHRLPADLYSLFAAAVA